ncbi:MAG TPA: hypothetical protein VFS55_07220 [Dokdonella sp.]|nr:hypothetical protein [Dokdonella sp.]
MAIVSRNGGTGDRTARAWLRALVIACAALAPCAHAQELMLAAGMDDLVEQAEWIVVADLVAATPRMNARGNLIVTDYAFRLEQSVLGAPPALEFVLSQGGGTLGGFTDHISDVADLGVGHRYLLFVRPDRHDVFPPFVGGAQGVYELGGDGTAISLGLARSTSDVATLLDRVRRLAAARGDQPPRRPAAAPAATAYPAKRFRPLALTPPSSAAARAPEAAPTPTGPNAAARRIANAATPQPLGGTAVRSSPQPQWHYDHRIDPPAIINAFPHDWEWHPSEENQLAYWNQYAGEIFRVYTTPTGTWAWGDDVFDLAGFPSDADMVAQFGEGWGPTSLGITYSRWGADNVTIEADTALNPARCWTLDDRYATSDVAGSDDCWSFRRTMVHEVGHTWGLRHPWETQAVSWDAVLNYAPHAYRFPQLFLDDTSAARAAFGGGLPIHDAALALYTTSLDTAAGAQSASYDATQGASIALHHGEDLAARISNQFKIENTGTDDIVAPRVDFYLTQDRMSWAGTTPFLASGSYVNIPAGWVYTYWLPAMPIPYSTPTGRYWLAGYLPDADAIGANDSAWGRETITVEVDNNPETLYPANAWQLSASGSLGPQGAWWFGLAAAAGTTYDLSLCGADGGWATLDTVLTVFDGATAVAYDDDGCGLQSRVSWTAPRTGTFGVQVASYQDRYQGTFQLAYRAQVADPIYADGFE